MRVVAANRDLRLIFALGFAQMFVRGAVNVFLVVVALELLNTGEPGAATLFAAMGAGGLLGAFGVWLLAGSRRLGRWLAVALLLWGAPIAVVAAVPTEPAALAMLAVVGLANAVIDVPLFTLPVRLAPDAVLARAFGVFESVALGRALGFAVTPALIALFRLRGALVATDDRAPRAARPPSPIPAGDTAVPPRRHRRCVLRGRRRGSRGARRRRGAHHRRAGGSFGEIALLEDRPRTATVRARTDLDVFEVDRQDFIDAVSGYRASATPPRPSSPPTWPGSAPHRRRGDPSTRSAPAWRRALGPGRVVASTVAP